MSTFCVLQIIQILAIFSEIWIHRHYLLTDPRTQIPSYLLSTYQNIDCLITT